MIIYSSLSQIKREISRIGTKNIGYKIEQLQCMQKSNFAIFSWMSKCTKDRSHELL